MATKHDEKMPNNEIETSAPKNLHIIDTKTAIKTAGESHDDALDYLQKNGEDLETFTNEEANRVRWKIDLILMPMVSETLL